MPALYLLAGANGSGKTTFYFSAASRKFIEPSIPFVNIEEIINREFGDYNEINHAKAEAVAKSRMAELIHNKMSFMVETNLAKDSEYDWIEKMMRAGYQSCLIFIGTDDVMINFSRVENRVKEGGHDVPRAIIEHRYNIGLTYLRRKILLFNEAHLIDNSADMPREVALLKNGIILEKESGTPDWAEHVLSLTLLIQNKKKKP